MQVVSCVGPAWDHTKRFLFQPFDLGRWLSLGVIFFLASLLEGGGGGFSNFRVPGSGTSPSGASPVVAAADALRSIGNFIARDPRGIVLAILGSITTLALIVLVTWLGARGELMAFRAVGMSSAAIGDSWRAVKTEAGSLFRVHLVLGGIGICVNLPLAIFALWFYVDIVDSGITDPRDVFVQLLPFLSVFALIAAVFGLVHAILRNFVAPMMVAFGVKAGVGFRIFRKMAAGNVGSIILFFLLKLTFAFMAALIATVVVLCTCCIGSLPVLNQTVLAPWLVFERSFTLHFIETAGAEYRMVIPPPEPYPYPAYYPPYPPY